jgi:hypothetical protein
LGLMGIVPIKLKPKILVLRLYNTKDLLRHLQTEGPGSLKTPGAFAYNTDKT